ncbi:archease [Candidatus Dependentiae bacterium]|nr:archease [Candidatus Dependentiae bacterium]
MTKDFEQLSHTADVQLRVYGKDIEELFRNALRGMFYLVVPKLPTCKMVDDRIVCDEFTCERDLKVTSPDRDALLVDFLSDALYFFAVHKEVYLDVMFKTLTDTKLEATIRGVKHEGMQLEIKAVTYHDLHIKKIDGTWQTDIVFDI